MFGSVFNVTKAAMMILIGESGKIKFFLSLLSNQIKNKRKLVQMKRGIRTRNVTKRHPPKEIDSIKNYFTPRRSEPEVKREMAEGRSLYLLFVCRVVETIMTRSCLQFKLINWTKIVNKILLLYHLPVFIIIIILKSSAEVFI